jgi:hypothetical protein
MTMRKSQRLKEPSRFVLNVDDDQPSTTASAPERRARRSSAPPSPRSPLASFEKRKAGIIDQLKTLEAQGVRRAQVLLAQVERLRPDETVGSLAEPVGRGDSQRMQRQLAVSHVLTEANSRLEAIEKTLSRLTGGSKKEVEISMTSLSNFVEGDGRTIFLATRNSAPVGTRMLVSINVKNMTQFEAEARVSFVRKGKTPGIGLELDHLPPSARAAVAMFGQFRDAMTREEASGAAGHA